MVIERKSIGKVFFERAKEGFGMFNLVDSAMKRLGLREEDLRWDDVKEIFLLHGITPPDVDLLREELRGADLRGADLRGADLRGANLRIHGE